MVTGNIFSALSQREVLALDYLTPSSYQRPTVEVARDLLGTVLIRALPEGLAAVRLTEVEAYLGEEDPASHTFRGRRTPRNASMWGEGGRLYVYFTYGLHHCANVVTRRAGEPEAVLLRGGVVVAGHEVVRARRGGREDLAGPAKLCQGLGIDRSMDGVTLTPEAGLWLARDRWARAGVEVVALPRVGVGYAGEAAAWPLRFVLRCRSEPEAFAAALEGRRGAGR